MAELDLIAALERSLRVRGDRVVRGLGDDAAVVRAAGVIVTSLDVVAEGIHFEWSTHEPADVGHKALGSALSDIAAMGAEPGEAYVGLALPQGFGEGRAIELMEAMEALAERSGATLAGGDVVAAAALVVSVTVTGWSSGPEALVYRDGARPGDLVGVTGELGGSGAGLALLQGAAPALDPDAREALTMRHRRPEPRLAAGHALAGAGATAMIDVSDGLATDAQHLCEASGVGIELALERLPLAPGVREVAAVLGRAPVEMAATAGEDYELLFTAPRAGREAAEAAARRAGCPVTWLGEVLVEPGLVLRGRDGRPVVLRGYEHE